MKSTTLIALLGLANANKIAESPSPNPGDSGGAVSISLSDEYNCL